MIGNNLQDLHAHAEKRPNADFITPWLATGGDLHADPALAMADLVLLDEAGVTHILDLRVEWSDEAFVAEHAPHITYVHLGVDDAGQAMPDEWFDAGVDLAADVVAGTDAKLLAHCHMGINRGPSMAYAILLSQGWSVTDALDDIRDARPIAGLAYAPDALAHFHQRTGADEEQIIEDRNALGNWFRQNHLDTASIIRGIRAAEGTIYR